MNKIVCTFRDGNVHTFSTEDHKKAIQWFNSLWDVEDMVSIQLLVDGRQVFEKSLYRNAV